MLLTDSICGRYFGFITKHPDEQRFACHVMMSDTTLHSLAETVGYELSFFFFSMYLNDHEEHLPEPYSYIIYCAVVVVLYDSCVSSVVPLQEGVPAVLQRTHGLLLSHWGHLHRVTAGRGPAVYWLLALRFNSDSKPSTAPNMYLCQHLHGGFLNWADSRSYRKQFWKRHKMMFHWNQKLNLLKHNNGKL